LESRYGKNEAQNCLHTLAVVQSVSDSNEIAMSFVFVDDVMFLHSSLICNPRCSCYG